MGTPSTNLGMTVPQIGGDSGPLFAQDVNGALAILDAVAGTPTSIDVSAGGTIVLSSSQLQAAIIIATGSPTTLVTLQMPTGVGRLMMFQNSTNAGSAPVQVQNAGGTVALLIPPVTAMLVYTDGTTPRFSNPYGYQEIGTGTFSGSAALTIPLGGRFRRYRVNMNNVQPSVNNIALGLQFSTDGGTTVTSTGYNTVLYGTDNIVRTFASGGNPPPGDVMFGSAGMVNTVPGFGADATWEISPGVPNVSVPTMRGSACHLWPSSNGTAFALFQVAGSCVVLASVANALRVLPVDANGVLNGTLSGTYVVEGLP